MFICVDSVTNFIQISLTILNVSFWMRGAKDHTFRSFYCWAWYANGMKEIHKGIDLIFISFTMTDKDFFIVIFE